MEIFTCETDNITEFNSKVIGFAQERDIPYQIEKLSAKDLRRLEKAGCQLIICGGYYHRIPTDTFLPMVNCHPSLLPHGRGAWPMPHAILNGDTGTGFTLHKLSKAFDQGDIILQRPCPIETEDNLETLSAKLQELAVSLIKEFIPQWENLYASAKAQGEGIYQTYLQESDFVITPQTTVAEADKILRAFYGYECIYQKEMAYAILRGVAKKDSALKEGSFPLVDGGIQVEAQRVL